MTDRDEFALRVINLQDRLSAYIYALVLNQELTHDILQRTNVVLLEKRDDYREEASFAAWACRIAYFEVLAARRDYQRERLIFDDDVLASLATFGETATAKIDDRLEALLECLAALPVAQREIILKRYQAGGSVQRLAEHLKRTPAAISNHLYRLRSRLLDCVRRKLDEAAWRP